MKQKITLIACILIFILIGVMVWWYKMADSKCQPLVTLTESVAKTALQQTKAGNYNLESILVSCSPSDSVKDAILESVKSFALQWREVAHDTSLTYKKEIIHQYGDSLFCGKTKIVVSEYKDDKITYSKTIGTLDSVAIWEPSIKDITMIPIQLKIGTSKSKKACIQEIYFLAFKR
jgi:hypothetical protein